VARSHLKDGFGLNETLRGTSTVSPAVLQRPRAHADLKMSGSVNFFALTNPLATADMPEATVFLEHREPLPLKRAPIDSAYKVLSIRGTTSLGGSRIT
jgi:hypothetical protein